MFFQVLVSNNNWNLLHFLWWHDRVCRKSQWIMRGVYMCLVAHLHHLAVTTPSKELPLMAKISLD